MRNRTSGGTFNGASNGPRADDMASISGDLAGALATSIGRAIHDSVDAWKKTAALDLARRVRAWRGGKVRESSESVDGLARELAALRREIAQREGSSNVDPAALADRIASAVTANLGGRPAASPPPPPPSAEPRERERIPFDDIAGIVDRLIQEQD
ncbi:MAG: hypothetical protein JXP34_10095 [Planctomycetes bacterium]|nr:hypothetical protein [Planctomycetota bacterium]